jgi:predicted phosphodiesterase
VASKKIVPEKLEQKRVDAESKRSQSHQALLSELSKKYDPTAKSEDLIEDLRKVKDENPYKYITRDFYRIHGKYSDRCWSNKFGTFQEFRRKAGLDLHRGAAQIEKDIARHAATDRYRGFFEMEVQPYLGKYERPEDSERYKTVMVCSDLHDKQLDTFCWKTFLDVAARLKPDTIVLAGDVFDEIEFSRFTNDPRQMNLKEAFDYVRDHIFKPLRKVCPNTQIDFVIGNHDLRIMKYMADRSPQIRPLMDLMGISLSKVLGLDEFEINLVSRIDFAAFKPADVRTEIKNNFKVYYNTVVVDHHGDNGFGMSGCSGHTHRTDMRSTANLTMGPIHWVVMGCMAKIDFEYQERMNKSHQSFCVWHVDTFLKQAIPEHVIFSDNMTVAGGKYYVRS